MGEEFRSMRSEKALPRDCHGEVTEPWQIRGRSVALPRDCHGKVTEPWQIRGSALGDRFCSSAVKEKLKTRFALGLAPQRLKSHVFPCFQG